MHLEHIIYFFYISEIGFGVLFIWSHGLQSHWSWGFETFFTGYLDWYLKPANVSLKTYGGKTII